MNMLLVYYADVVPTSQLLSSTEALELSVIPENLRLRPHSIQLTKTTGNGHYCAESFRAGEQPKLRRDKQSAATERQPLVSLAVSAHLS